VARSKRPTDVNELAASIVEATTSGTPIVDENGKNAAAVALGRLGGLKGGPARAAKLSAKQRTESARKAAAARWANRKES
jgi:hypothetical protein